MGIAVKPSVSVFVLTVVLVTAGIVSGCGLPGSVPHRSLGGELIRLQEAHNREAITTFEWEGAKHRLVDAYSRVPDRSLGDELIWLKEAHDREAITDFGWATAKRRLIDVYSAR